VIMLNYRTLAIVAVVASSDVVGPSKQGNG